MSHARQMYKTAGTLWPKGPQVKIVLCARAMPSSCVHSLSSIELLATQQLLDLRIPKIGTSNRLLGIFLNPTKQQFFPCSNSWYHNASWTLPIRSCILDGGSGFSTGRHLHRSAGKVGFTCSGVLGVVVGDGRFDSVLGKHGTVYYR